MPWASPRSALCAGHASANPVLVERWQAEAFPAIAAKAKRVGAVIFFGDAAGMRSDHHAGTTWSPLGRTPTVATTGRRFGIHMLSAVAPTGALHFMLHDGRVTAAVFVEFLRRLLHDANAPVFLVLDGHRMNTAKRVQEFAAAQVGRLKLWPASHPELFVKSVRNHPGPNCQVPCDCMAACERGQGGRGAIF